MNINKISFSTLDSTSTYAKEHAHEFDPAALTLITADEQTKGRGRFSRSWVSPKGCNLYVTYVYFQDHIPSNIGNLPQILALSAYDTLQDFPVKLKWPNDLVIESKKLGGILTEVIQVESKWAISVAIGININMKEEDLAKIDRPATTLTGDREKISEAIHQSFHLNLEKFLKEGFAPFLDAYRKAIIHKPGEFLCFSNFKEKINGTFQEIQEDGALLIELPDGTSLRCISGELV